MINIEFCTSNDLWGLLDGGWSVSAVQHHNGMNMSLLVNDGDRFGPGAPASAYFFIYLHIFCIFLAYAYIFYACKISFLHNSCIFKHIYADPFQLARLLAVPVLF